jgi:hypothetical protein
MDIPQEPSCLIHPEIQVRRAKAYERTNPYVKDNLSLEIAIKVEFSLAMILLLVVWKASASAKSRDIMASGQSR